MHRYPVESVVFSVKHHRRIIGVPRPGTPATPRAHNSSGSALTTGDFPPSGLEAVASGHWVESHDELRIGMRRAQPCAPAELLTDHVKVAFRSDAAPTSCRRQTGVCPTL